MLKELTYRNSTSEESSRYKPSYIQCLKTKHSILLYKFLHFHENYFCMYPGQPNQLKQIFFCIKKIIIKKNSYIKSDFQSCMSPPSKAATQFLSTELLQWNIPAWQYFSRSETENTISQELKLFMWKHKLRKNLLVSQVKGKKQRLPDGAVHVSSRTNHSC